MRFLDRAQSRLPQPWRTVVDWLVTLALAVGFVLAALALCAPAQKASTAVSILVPILALGVPILDTLFSIVRRFLERRPIFSPDRGHIHHRLLDMGVTHRRAVLILYGLSILFTLAAMAVSIGRSWQVGAAIVGAAAALVGVVRFVGYFEYLHSARRQKARLRTPDTERVRSALPDLARALSSSMRVARALSSARV